MIEIDQSPIGRRPRSNPATYTGVFDQIRKLFAQTQEAQDPRLRRGRFSFNVKGGRCETCQGDGQIKIEMQFLPDVYVPCESCHGTRYNRETLEVRFKGKSIADVLEMPVDEAREFFANIPKINRRAADAPRRRSRLHPARPAGDDAVRRRGAARQAGDELSKVATGETLYILDEPTTGLHFADVDGCSTSRPARRPREHGRRHRAQPRRHQVGRLDHRPRARGRRRRRRDHRQGTPEQVADRARPPTPAVSSRSWSNQGRALSG